MHSQPEACQCSPEIRPYLDHSPVRPSRFSGVQKRIRKEKAPPFAGLLVAARLGFEPELTDPESGVVWSEPSLSTTTYACGSTGLYGSLTTPYPYEKLVDRGQTEPTGTPPKRGIARYESEGRNSIGAPATSVPVFTSGPSCRVLLGVPTGPPSQPSFRVEVEATCLSCELRGKRPDRTGGCGGCARALRTGSPRS